MIDTNNCTRPWAVSSVLAIAGLIGGCIQVDAIEQDTQGGDAVPDAVQAVFDARCATSGCHAPPGQANLSLDRAGAATLLTGRNASQAAIPLVEFGDLSRSYLAIKILSDTALVGGMRVSDLRVDSRMPVGADFSDPDLNLDLALVLGWIAGADLGDGSMDTMMPSTTGMTDGMTDGATDTTADVMSCSVEDIAEVPKMLETGDAAIPPEIGTILTANCGCHLTETPKPDSPQTPFPLGFDILTLAGWQGDVSERGPVYDIVLNRVGTMMNMPPPALCQTAEGEAMDPTERDILIEWLTMGAPSGADWGG